MVEDGKEALDFLLCRDGYSDRDINHPPKLVLLDLKLPHVSGLEVLRQIRNCEHTKSIPVVILTSSAIDYDITSAYKLGVNSYIQKPMDFGEFQNTVKTIGEYWLGMNKNPI